MAQTSRSADGENVVVGEAVAVAVARVWVVLGDGFWEVRGGSRTTYCNTGDKCLEHGRFGQHDRWVGMFVLSLEMSCRWCGFRGRNDHERFVGMEAVDLRF